MDNEPPRRDDLELIDAEAERQAEWDAVLELLRTEGLRKTFREVARIGIDSGIWHGKMNRDRIEEDWAAHRMKALIRQHRDDSDLPVVLSIGRGEKAYACPRELMLFEEYEQVIEEGNTGLRDRHKVLRRLARECEARFGRAPHVLWLETPAEDEEAA